MAAELLIQFSTSTAFASAIIRRLTHSPFSHVDAIITDELAQHFKIQPGLLGASGPDCGAKAGRLFRHKMGWSHDPGGVIVRPNPAWAYLQPPKTSK
jgi:hypothetical protein